MSRGGARPGAGRPKGSRNHITLELVKAVQRDGLTPLEYLLKVMRDGSLETSQRLEAAKIALPYCHSRLVAVNVSQDLASRCPEAGNVRSAKQILEDIVSDFDAPSDSVVKVSQIKALPRL